MRNSRYLLMLCNAALVLLVLCGACAGPGQGNGDGHWEKVELDLGPLDEDGLRGPPDGKVAVSYEFAIPDTGPCKAEVRAIDPTVEFMCGSPGRIGAGEGECLCVGSTDQENYREVLRALSELPYLERIIECHFE